MRRIRVMQLSFAWMIEKIRSQRDISLAHVPILLRNRTLCQ